jgi:poly-gamma-glutamate synthesis protein (capsule biosynthesis protein)
MMKMDKNKTLLFLGDVVPFKPFRFRNNLKTVINLECPIIKDGIPEGGKINLKVKENYLEDIFGDNLYCVNIGNNHILDYGKQGLDSTLIELSKLKTHIFGLNRTRDDLYNPLIVDYNSIRIAFISVVCMSTSPLLQLDDGLSLSVLDTDEILKKVSGIRASVQRIVVYIHWGTEESSYPEIKEILAARKLIDGGVDIVIGSHAHAPQPIERYNNGIIAYNLGNFIMPDLRNIPTYFTGSGEPQSTYNKSTMPWNRISWGLAIDMSSMDFKVMKYMFLNNRVIRLRITPFDRHLKLTKSLVTQTSGDIISRHIRRRALYRRIRDFIQNPHIPEKIKRIL